MMIQMVYKRENTNDIPDNGNLEGKPPGESLRGNAGVPLSDKIVKLEL